MIGIQVFIYIECITLYKKTPIIQGEFEDKMQKNEDKMRIKCRK